MFQRLPIRLYERFGPRVLFGGFGLMFLSGVPTLVGTSIWSGRYLHVPGPKLWAAVGVASAFLLVIVPIMTLTQRSAFTTLLSWSGSDRSEAKAREVWNTILDLQRKLPLLAPSAAVWGVPIVAAVKLTTGISVATAAGEYLAGVAGTCGGFVPFVFGFELLMRPMLQDVAQYLPERFDPTGGGVRVRTKAIAAITSVALFSALTAGAFDTIVASGPVRMVVAVAIALACSALAGGIFWVVMRSLLDPVDELLAGTQRVGHGDIETPVPVVTADELGSLSSGFNRMLADLRRHERELQESRARIVAAADDARRRVERDLHDGAQQELVLLGLKLGATRRLVDADSPVGRRLAELEGDLSRALAGLRDLAHGIYPQRLQSDGLLGALRDAATRAAIPTNVDCDGVGRYPAEVEAAVYFCCLEALQNAAKHAGAGARVEIMLCHADRAVSFEVRDDGAGFEVGNGATGAGLQNMADRIGALGGKVRLTSHPGAGTTVQGTVPLGG